MRRKSTFLLTILPAETSQADLHGSLRTVADGTQATFSSLEELYELIRKAVTHQDERSMEKQPAIHSNPSQAA